MKRLSLLVVLVMCAFSVQAQDGVMPQGKEVEKPWRKAEPTKKKAKKKTTSNKKLFQHMARDLLGKPKWSERFINLISDDVAQIAIAPLKADQLPISEQEAQLYLDGLAGALIKQAGTRYAIVSRKELGALVKEIDEMGTRRESVNPIGDLFDRARSDLVAVNHLSLSGEKVLLSVKLVETETGRIVSSSQRKFKRLQTKATQAAGTVTLEAATRNAAQRLLRDVNEVNNIMVQGLRYQSSGAHSEFSRYFLNLMSAALRDHARTGPRNINDLSISDFIVREEVFRGLALTETAKGQGELNIRKTQDYILKGTYWLFDDVVEIRLNLSHENGEVVSWQGRVLRTDIPTELDLIPPPPPVAATDRETIGPVGLSVTSNKGDNPRFNIGQKMVMAIEPTKDSYVACYYVQADGAIYRIFPNRFTPSGAMNGGFVQHIPSQGMPFEFEFVPPAGVEAVKCFATDKDVSRTVEKTLGRGAFSPLRVKSERELSAIYRNLPQVSLSETTMIITVQ